MRPKCRRGEWECWGCEDRKVAVPNTSHWYPPPMMQTKRASRIGLTPSLGLTDPVPRFLADSTNPGSYEAKTSSL